MPKCTQKCQQNFFLGSGWPTRVGFFNPSSSLKHFVMRIPLSLPRGLLFSSTDGFKKTLSHCLQNRSQIFVIVR